MITDNMSLELRDLLENRPEKFQAICDLADTHYRRFTSASTFVTARLSHAQSMFNMVVEDVWLAKEIVQLPLNLIRQDAFSCYIVQFSNVTHAVQEYRLPSYGGNTYDPATGIYTTTVKYDDVQDMHYDLRVLMDECYNEMINAVDKINKALEKYSIIEQQERIAAEIRMSKYA
jgi:hypothetical protein